MKPHQFRDFDEYASTISHVDLDVKLIHPNAEKQLWSLQQIELQSLRLQFAIEGSGILAIGKMNSGGFGLYAQLTGDPVCVNGKRIGPGSIAVFPPDAEFVIAGHGSIGWFSVFIPKQLLIADTLRPSRSSSVFVLSGQSESFNLLHSLARKIQRYSERLDLSHSRTTDYSILQDDLLSTVQEILSNGATSLSSGFTLNARGLVALAVELIHDCQDLKLSVRQLAENLDVSERTLQYAFRNHFDISPQEFLINYRLHQARKYLQTSDPGQTTVAMAAAKNGFFDFGRFAAKYRQTFGEHPSMTLRRLRGLN